MFCLWKLDSFRLKVTWKALWIFFFNSVQQLLEYNPWIFWKKQVACDSCLGGHLTLQSHLTRIVRCMALITHHSQNTLWKQVFLWMGPMCLMWAFTLLESWRDIFCVWKLVLAGKSSIFPLWNYSWGLKAAWKTLWFLSFYSLQWHL